MTPVEDTSTSSGAQPMAFDRSSRRPEKAGDSAAILRQILQIGEVPLPDYRVWRTQVQRVEPLLCLNRFGIETEPGIVVPLKQLTPSQRFQLRSKPRAILFIPHLSTSPELKELGFQPDGKTPKAVSFQMEFTGRSVFSLKFEMTE